MQANVLQKARKHALLAEDISENEEEIYINVLTQKEDEETDQIK